MQEYEDRMYTAECVLHDNGQGEKNTKEVEQSKTITTICSAYKGCIARILLFCFLKASACHTCQNTKDYDQTSLSQTLIIFKIS